MYAHNSLLFMLAKLSFSVGCGKSTLSNKKFGICSFVWVNIPRNLGKIISKYQWSLWSEDCAKVDMKHHVTMLTNNFVKYLNTCETYTKVLI